MVIEDVNWKDANALKNLDVQFFLKCWTRGLLVNDRRSTLLINPKVQLYS